MPDERKADDGGEEGADKSRRTVARHLDRRVIRLLAQPRRFARAALGLPIVFRLLDLRQHGEIEHRRRRGRRPFERAAVPRIAGHVAQRVLSNDAHDELSHLADDGADENENAKAGNQNPGTPFRHIIMLKPPGHAEDSDNVQGHEGDIEADKAEPERGPPPTLVQTKAERLRPPIGDCREERENHASDDDMMEVRNQEHAVVQDKIGGRYGKQYARQTAGDEGGHERERPQHRRVEADAAAIHGEQPVVHFDAGADGNNAGGDAEDGVDVPARAHGEEMMQPGAERNDADEKRRRHHRAVAEQRFAGEGGNHFRIDAERRQDENVDLRVSPRPDEVHEHHGVAAGLVGEEMKAEIAVEGQHRERRGQDREGGENEQARRQRRPAEHRHAQIGHAGGADFENGRDEIDTGQKRANAGDLYGP